LLRFSTCCKKSPSERERKRINSLCAKPWVQGNCGKAATSSGALLHCWVLGFPAVRGTRKAIPNCRLIPIPNCRRFCRRVKTQNAVWHTHTQTPCLLLYIRFSYFISFKTH
jgi:hypothetical protein